MMKKYVAKLIGIFLVVYLGFDYIYRVIFQTVDLTINTFFNTFLNLVFAAAAIYGGVNLFRLQEVGRKVSVICFTWILLQIAIIQFPKFWSGKSLYLTPHSVKYLIIVMCVFTLYTTALALLLDNKAIEIMNYDDHIMQKTGVIFAYCAPGLGRALTDNFLIGMSLFFFYQWIMSVVFSQQEPIAIILLGLITWQIFFFIDFAAVKKAFEIEQVESATEN